MGLMLSNVLNELLKYWHLELNFNLSGKIPELKLMLTK